MINNIPTAALIPARLDSTRLPRKVLRDIHGKPLIQHVYENTSQSELVDEVYVATPDIEIIDVVKSFGGKAVLTTPQPTVLDCCADAAELLVKLNYEFFVVVQGDEPMVRSEMIDLALKPFPKYASVSCLVKKLDDGDDPWNPNTVKVIKDAYDHIIYLSRSVIPGVTPEKYDTGSATIYKQVCIMGFTDLELSRFHKFSQEFMERSEGIDLVRYPEHGCFYVVAVESQYDTQAVDTAEDLEKVRRLME